MTLLFVDTETSGLFKKNLPMDSAEQPWIVSLAAELCTNEGRQIACINTGIRANGRTIGSGAQSVHGVSSAVAGRTGVSELAALGVLCGRESLASQARIVVGHGISFDRDIITSVLARNGRDATTWVRPGLEFRDTMTVAAAFCKLPSEHENGGYRWPKLREALVILLGEQEPVGLHNAWVDIQAVKRLYFWLVERGAYEVAA